MNENAALDIAGLAAFLKVSKTTAHRLASTGEVPGFKIGNRWRFWPDEIRRAMAARDPWRTSPPARARRRNDAIG